MEDDRPAEDDAAEAEPDAATPNETEDSRTEEPETEEPETEESRTEGTETESGEAAERPAPDPETRGGISATTTTGDRDKDVGGPSVTEESRRKMEGDEALDEPGYGDLGHAEDFDILRDD